MTAAIALVGDHRDTVIAHQAIPRALALAGELSAAPGAGGKPIHEWLELRPFLGEPPTVTE